MCAKNHAEIQQFSRRKLPVFSSFEQAITWLVKDEVT